VFGAGSNPDSATVCAKYHIFCITSVYLLSTDCNGNQTLAEQPVCVCLEKNHISVFADKDLLALLFVCVQKIFAQLYDHSNISYIVAKTPENFLTSSGAGAHST
jgi:hypothetical protein